MIVEEEIYAKMDKQDNSKIEIEPSQNPIDLENDVTNKKLVNVEELKQDNLIKEVKQDLQEEQNIGQNIYMNENPGIQLENEEKLDTAPDAIQNGHPTNQAGRPSIGSGKDIYRNELAEKQIKMQKAILFVVSSLVSLVIIDIIVRLATADYLPKHCLNGYLNDEGTDYLCKECENGYILFHDGSFCFPPPSKCTSGYSNEQHIFGCTECEEGFGLMHDKSGCYKLPEFCIKGFSSDDVEIGCSECQSGYGVFHDKTRCYQLPENCQDGLSTLQLQVACQTCEDGYILKSNQLECYSISPEVQKILDTSSWTEWFGSQKDTCEQQDREQWPTQEYIASQHLEDIRKLRIQTIEWGRRSFSSMQVTLSDGYKSVQWGTSSMDEIVRIDKIPNEMIAFSQVSAYCNAGVGFQLKDIGTVGQNEANFYDSENKFEVDLTDKVMVGVEVKTYEQRGVEYINSFRFLLMNPNA